MSERNSGLTCLIVDDEKLVRQTISAALMHLQLNVREAENGVEALEMMKREPVDIVLLDINLPYMKGPEVLLRIRESFPQILVIMITGFPSAESAAECMKNGAVDYLTKPFRMKTLVEVVSEALNKIHALKGGAVSENPQDPVEKIIGNSPAIQELKEKIKRVSCTNSTVLITGESGTGKDLFARTIHDISPRARNDFVPVDCSVLVESLLESELFGHMKGAFTGADGNKIGLFEIANKGTFFFDEVSNLSHNIQCKLLRVIQEREFRKVGSQQRQNLDIRILCASNRDLKKAVDRGTFRNDLYYRINVVPLHLPPLRERWEDIPLLLDYFLGKYRHLLGHDCEGFSDNALELMTTYPWPGNVRELQHLVEQVLVLEKCGRIRVRHLPPVVTQRRGVFNVFSETLSLEDMEKRYIQFVLQKTRGLRQQTADILAINRKTLASKIKKYGL
ncbi:MAG: sigma-54 dependent transcriptional regulator [Pseudomonadota bacterium]